MNSSEAELIRLIPLLFVGSVAGFLNSLAGGGSLLTLPALLFLGMPAPVANATNRVGLVMQNIAAGTAFHRKGKLPLKLTLKLFLPALPGAALGAWLAIDVDDVLFRRLLVAIMLLAIYSIVRGAGSKPSVDSAPSIPHPRALTSSLFFMGFYAGFIQAGLGFLLIAVLTNLGGFDLIRTNAIKMSIVLLMQVVALAIFSRAGTVDWSAGAMLAIGTTLGAWSGAHWQMSRGVVWVRRVLVVIMVLFTLRLIQESISA